MTEPTVNETVIVVVPDEMAITVPLASTSAMVGLADAKLGAPGLEITAPARRAR